MPGRRTVDAHRFPEASTSTSSLEVQSIVCPTIADFKVRSSGRPFHGLGFSSLTQRTGGFHLREAGPVKTAGAQGLRCLDE
jgi:hypothetical protein